MSRPIISPSYCVLLLAGLLAAPTASAREAVARIDRIETGVADLEEVVVELSWPRDEAEGQLRLRAREIDAPALGYRFRDVSWECPLLRGAGNAWHCEGPVSGAVGVASLSVTLEDEDVSAELQRGPANVRVHRSGSSPDVTRIDLVAIPLAWTQALLSKAWEEGRLGQGRVDASLQVSSMDEGIGISGPLQLASAGLDTPDGTIAAAGIDASLQLDATIADTSTVSVDGVLEGGELLFGSTYVALGQRRVSLGVRAIQEDTQGWRLPAFSWNDPGILTADGSAVFGGEMALDALVLEASSPDLSRLADGYLSGWLGTAGLADLRLQGSADARIEWLDGALSDALVRLHAVDVDDPAGRFEFEHLDGDLRFSGGSDAASQLSWQGGTLYGLPFGAARLPFSSKGGAIWLREEVDFPILGGQATLSDLHIVPPGDGAGMQMEFGLGLASLDVSRLSEALGWPAFTGELSGTLPSARYADNRLVLDGGLEMQLFGGKVTVGSLSMERPFGVLPTLSADVAFDDIDLLALTGAFDFGSITGKLDGRVQALRLVDWQPVAFDAWLNTDRHRGVRQRISQRAVQDLTSVGNSSFVGSLQAQLIGFFDDFGYSRIGIGCTLADEVCTMTGLVPAGAGFVIVEGSGLPRLTVVGFNRRVDWPILVERLQAVGSGDVKPVVD